MSYAARKTQIDKDERYDNLVVRRDQLVANTQKWMNDATNLHTDSDAAEKADVVALRDAMVASLRSILGV